MTTAERQTTHFGGDSCPGGHYEDVSAPPRPRPADVPETGPDSPPPEPDYAAWLPSDYLSRGWCKGPNGAIYTALRLGSITRAQQRHLSRTLADMIDPQTTSPRLSIALFNDRRRKASVALAVLREAERRCGLRAGGAA
jgi:hypothetical protein